MIIRLFALLMFISLLSACSDKHCDNAKQTVGLFQHEPTASEGYTLYSPTLSNKTYLINNEGQRVHSWESKHQATSSSYLLPNGHLLRNGLFNHSGGNFFGHHGSIAQIEEYSWDGKLVWYYELSTDNYQLHHDIAYMPNGHILAIAWERLSPDEAVALGRNPKQLNSKENQEVWSEMLIEIVPDYTKGSGGTIVWEWHLNDHLVQDIDPDKPHYFGKDGVAQHPERINFNYISPFGKTDWVHLNAIDYNPKTDHIMVSSPEFNELWIIDHQSGEIIYRFGNPRAFNQGTKEQQQFFYQHDAQWIHEGLPGAGNILVFNNGLLRNPPKSHSTVLEINPDIGHYGKGSVVWSYEGSPRSSFFSPIISGVQRLPNGNTLINEGTWGRLFEVTPQGSKVWHYINPDANGHPLKQGETIPRTYFVPVPNLFSNLVFRGIRYPADYPGLANKKLVPLGPIETPCTLY